MNLRDLVIIIINFTFNRIPERPFLNPRRRPRVLFTRRSKLTTYHFAVFERIHDSYDMNQHSRTGSPQAAQLTTSFAQEFGIFGPPSYCIDRIAKLVELGVDRFFCVGPGPGSGSAESVEAAERLSNEVMPTFRTNGN